MANEFKRMQKLAGLIVENQEYYKDAEADDAEHIDALEKDMEDDAKHTSEGKIKMSDLKKAIKELAEGEDDVNFNSDTSLYDPVYEAKKDEEVEDIEDVDVAAGDEEITTDVVTTDVDPDVKAVQDALTQAQAAAEKLGDEKLTDQIGNTITFFTRTHIVEKPNITAESNIKERIDKLIKSL